MQIKPLRSVFICQDWHNFVPYLIALCNKSKVQIKSCLGAANHYNMFLRFETANLLLICDISNYTVTQIRHWPIIS